MSLRIAAVSGNPRPDSRTQGLAHTLAVALASELSVESPIEVDLALLGGRVLDADDKLAIVATEQVLAADLLVLASPTYYATYTGLLKAFLDRLGTSSLVGKSAVPILLGGARNHQLALDVHFTPLLLELGAHVPARGLFVLESEVPDFEGTALSWARANARVLVAFQDAGETGRRGSAR